jgi:hypothetical protein
MDLDLLIVVLLLVVLPRLEFTHPLVVGLIQVAWTLLVIFVAELIAQESISDTLINSIRCRFFRRLIGHCSVELLAEQLSLYFLLVFGGWS